MSLPQLVEVTVEQGILRGERVSAQDNGLPYDAFRGIPYAQKPMGPLRFKAPRPPEPWEGVRLALNEGSMAPQLSGGKMLGSEDCLFLNVYTPQVPSSVATRSPGFRGGAPWPIMFWLHPGAFTTGSGSATDYGPELLVAKDVVVVTVNYRLGPLGFLSLSSPAATGNYGLKDMLAALRWVNKNGSVFGGDINKVTLFGCSAGSGGVQYLQLAPGAKGLFHRAIATSGSCLCPWAVGYNPRSRTLRLARKLGATENDLANDEKILQFMRGQSPEAILLATSKILPLPEDTLGGLAFTLVPAIEKGMKPDDPEDEIFLPGNPRDLIKQGRVSDVPLMMGFCDVEGLLADAISAGAFIRAVPEVLARYDEHLEICLPAELKTVFPDGSQKQKEVIQRLRSVYFNGGAVSEATKNGYYNLIGDLLMNNGILQEACMHARTSIHPVYFFSFAVKGKINKISSRFGDKYDETPGACHADELNYIWTTQPPTPTFEPDSLEAKTRHRMVTLWTNFTKTGNPTPDGETSLEGIRWPAIPKDLKTSVPYLHIGKTLSVPREGLFEERVNFWNSLYSELE